MFTYSSSWNSVIRPSVNGLFPLVWSQIGVQKLLNERLKILWFRRWTSWKRKKVNAKSFFFFCFFFYLPIHVLQTPAHDPQQWMHSTLTFLAGQNSGQPIDPIKAVFSLHWWDLQEFSWEPGGIALDSVGRFSAKFLQASSM